MRVVYYFLILVFLNSCQRDLSVNNNQQTQEQPHGIIYSSGRQKITAFDIAQEKMLWQTTVANALDVNSTIYNNGTIYSNVWGGVLAIDAADGHIKWKQNDGGIGGFDPIGGMPVVKDTFLYSIGSNLNLVSTLYCLSTNTGSIIWKKPLQAPYSTEDDFGTPVVVGDKVIGVGHGGSSGAPINSICCFNRFNGVLVWNNESTVTSKILPFPFSPDSSQVIFAAGIVGVPDDGLFSFDVNSGTPLWHDPAMVISPTQMTLYQNNQMILFSKSHLQTATYNLSTKTLGNIISDTIKTATVYKDKIFLSKYIGPRLQCRSAYNNTIIWEQIDPYKQIWDTLDISYISNSYTSTLVTDEDNVYYYEYIWHGPPPSLGNSLFIYSASTGTMLKEIKIKDTDTPLSKTFFVVKDGKAYYPSMR